MVMATQLFMVYLGGSATGASIELHDIQFVVGDTIEDTFPQLRQRWFGNKKGLHLDSYLALHSIDGYALQLVSASTKPSRKRLYFVNFGGYIPQHMAEQHYFTLVVADSPEHAKQRARSQLASTRFGALADVHKDDLLQVDDCLALDLIDGYSVQLQPLTTGQESQLLQPDWFGYRVIG